MNACVASCWLHTCVYSLTSSVFFFLTAMRYLRGLWLCFFFEIRIHIIFYHHIMPNQLKLFTTLVQNREDTRKTVWEGERRKALNWFHMTCTDGMLDQWMLSDNCLNELSCEQKLWCPLLSLPKETDAAKQELEAGHPSLFLLLAIK